MLQYSKYPFVHVGQLEKKKAAHVNEQKTEQGQSWAFYLDSSSWNSYSCSSNGKFVVPI